MDFFPIINRMNKELYCYMFEHANKRKHAFEHNCFQSGLNILSHLVHLADLAYIFISLF